MDNNIYHMIKNIKKVSGFLGSKGTPVPVSDKEIEKILGQIKDGIAQPKSAVEYSIGEKVQVIDGPFASFSSFNFSNIMSWNNYFFNFVRYFCLFRFLFN